LILRKWGMHSWLYLAGSQVPKRIYITCIRLNKPCLWLLKRITACFYRPFLFLGPRGSAARNPGAFYQGPAAFYQGPAAFYQGPAASAWTTKINNYLRFFLLKKRCARRGLQLTRAPAGLHSNGTRLQSCCTKGQVPAGSPRVHGSPRSPLPGRAPFASQKPPPGNAAIAERHGIFRLSA
jgi:hypothetical protein